MSQWLEKQAGLKGIGEVTGFPACPSLIGQHKDLARAMQELPQLYCRLDEQLQQLLQSAGRTPVCVQGGCCCKFEMLDHRLYVSTLELAFLLSQPPPSRPANPHRCPYQRQNACLGHQRRPLGCRTFFCRFDGEGCRQLHERFHRDIALLHQTHCLPYVYAELAAFIASAYPLTI